MGSAEEIVRLSDDLIRSSEEETNKVAKEILSLGHGINRNLATVHGSDTFLQTRI